MVTNRRQSTLEIQTPPMPVPDSFSFTNVLAAVDSRKVRGSLNAIAQICANASVSSASAHHVHRIPHGDINTRPRLTKTLASVPEANSSSEGLSIRDEWDFVQEGSSEWPEDETTFRKVALSSIPGLHRMALPCKPVVGVSRAEAAV